MRIAISNVREPRVEGGLGGEAPARGELGFAAPETVVDQRHRIERAVGVVGVELDDFDAHVAVHSRQVLEARLAAARAIARLLRKGDRILEVLGHQAGEQMPASDELRASVS